MKTGLYQTNSTGEFLCQKDAFLCAAQGIEIKVAFIKRMGAGLFGSEEILSGKSLQPAKKF